MKRPTLFDFLKKRGLIRSTDSVSEEETKSKEAGTPPVSEASEASEGSRRPSEISKRSSGFIDGIRKAFAGLGLNPRQSTADKRKSVAETTDTEFPSNEDSQSSAEESPRTPVAERPPMPTTVPSGPKPRTWVSAGKKSQTASSEVDVAKEDILPPTHDAPAPPTRAVAGIKQPHAVPKKVTADRKLNQDLLAEAQKRVAGNPRPPKLADQFRNRVAIQAEQVQAAKTETQQEVNYVSDGANTPLHIAVEKGNIEDVKKYLTGVKIPNSPQVIQFDPNVQNSAGRTALHIAAEKGNVDMVTVLLDNNANTEIRDKKGDTPLDISLRNEAAQTGGDITSPLSTKLIEHQQQQSLAETAVTEQKTSAGEEKKASPTARLKEFKQRRADEGKPLPAPPKSPTLSARVEAMKKSQTGDKASDTAAEVKSESSRTFKS